MAGFEIVLELGHTPSTAGTFRKKFQRNSGKTPETLSERFLEFPSRVRLGPPKPYNSRHLKAPEHFQNSLPPQYGWGRFFFQKWFGEGLSESVMEFPAVLGVFLMNGTVSEYPMNLLRLFFASQRLFLCSEVIFSNPIQKDPLRQA